MPVKVKMAPWGERLALGGRAPDPSTPLATVGAVTRANCGFDPHGRTRAMSKRTPAICETRDIKDVCALSDIVSIMFRTGETAANSPGPAASSGARRPNGSTRRKTIRKGEFELRPLTRRYRARTARTARQNGKQPPTLKPTFGDFGA